MGLAHTDSGTQVAPDGIPAHRRRLDTHTLPWGKELALHCPLTPGPLLVIEPEEHLGAVPPQLHRKEWLQRPTHTLFENRSSVFLLLHNRKIITYSEDQPSPITRSKKQPIQLVFLFPAEAPRHRSFRGRGSQRPVAVSVLIVHLGPAGGTDECEGDHARPLGC